MRFNKNELADVLGLELVLLRVETDVQGHEEAQAYLATITRWLAAANISVQTTQRGESLSELLLEPPTDIILAYVEAKDVALVVISSHGRSGLSRWVYGSVAHKLVHYSPAPVLVIRSREDDATPGATERLPFARQKLHSLLVPLDGSSLSEAILPLLSSVAAGSEASLTLLRVVPFRVPELMQEAEAYLQAIQERLQAEGLTVSSAVLVGDTAAEIHDYARTHACDLIAMSTHGSTGLQRWLMGSVAERVLHGTEAPLLLYRPDTHTTAPAPPAG